MSTRAVERIGDWERRSFDGGYRGLWDLADADFSGVVTAGTARLCMLNGRVVGVLGGRIEDFEDASGTAHVAPSPALPLLIVMQERDESPRAKYYTEDTPISEVDDTLSEGGFTGYIELSENVLSGDYYVVYHKGRSMAVAFVGESKRLLSDDEAFERADDEVGIYEVRQVDVEVVDIPEPELEPEPEPEPRTGAVGGTAAAAGTDDRGDTTDDADRTTGDAVDESNREPPDEDVPLDAGTETPDEGRTASTSSADGTPREEEPTASATRAASESDSAAADRRASAGRASDEGSADREESAPDRSPGSGRDRSPDEQRGGDAVGSDASGGPDAGGEPIETRSVPSIDPERTGTTGADGDGPLGALRGDRGRTEQGPTSPGAGESVDGRSGRSSPDPTGADADQPASAGADEEGAPSEAGEVDRLESRVEELEAERDRLRAEREELEAERDRLAERVRRLERRIERLEDDDDGEPVEADRVLDPGEAISATNLFVRYDSKGEATLGSVHDGRATREEVEANLGVEYHTQFDADEVAVAGEPFESFLRSTMEYRFIRWVVGELLYEIRDTGHEDELRDLYDALPRIDRMELDGIVTVEYVEDGETHRAQQSFDLVFRDRMGNVLIVADLHESREPATEDMMASLVTASERVGRSNETLAASFLVTSSFFEPEALETAADATGGGLLSRDKRESFVRLARKSGFHLCLVEAREEKFHMAVPEL